jgi:hypothetical protein
VNVTLDGTETGCVSGFVAYVAGLEPMSRCSVARPPPGLTCATTVAVVGDVTVAVTPMITGSGACPGNHASGTGSRMTSLVALSSARSACAQFSVRFASAGELAARVSVRRSLEIVRVTGNAPGVPTITSSPRAAADAVTPPS